MYKFVPRLEVYSIIRTKVINITRIALSTLYHLGVSTQKKSEIREIAAGTATNPTSTGHNFSLPQIDGSEKTCATRIPIVMAN